MIKASELRVGNLFVDTKGSYCTPNTIQEVISIGRDGVNHWQDMGSSGCCPFDKMMPIPLTPEILESAGFKKMQYNEQVLIYSIKFIKDGLFNAFQLKEGIGCFMYGVTLVTKTKYLHQLQNLFHSLTGSELEIKAMALSVSQTS